MEKPIFWLRVFLGFTGLFFFLGFVLSAFSPDYVFLGIFFMGIGFVFALMNIVPATKIMQTKNKRQLDRITKLEEDVARLKASKENKE